MLVLPERTSIISILIQNLIQNSIHVFRTQCTYSEPLNPYPESDSELNTRIQNSSILIRTQYTYSEPLSHYLKYKSSNIILIRIPQTLFQLGSLSHFSSHQNLRANTLDQSPSASISNKTIQLFAQTELSRYILNQKSSCILSDIFKRHVRSSWKCVTGVKMKQFYEWTEILF